MSYTRTVQRCFSFRDTVFGISLLSTIIEKESQPIFSNLPIFIYETSCNCKLEKKRKQLPRFIYFPSLTSATSNRIMQFDTECMILIKQPEFG